MPETGLRSCSWSQRYSVATSSAHPTPRLSMSQRALEQLRVMGMSSASPCTSGDIPAGIAPWVAGIFGGNRGRLRWSGGAQRSQQPNEVLMEGAVLPFRPGSALRTLVTNRLRLASEFKLITSRWVRFPQTPRAGVPAVPGLP